MMTTGRHVTGAACRNLVQAITAYKKQAVDTSLMDEGETLDHYATRLYSFGVWRMVMVAGITFFPGGREQAEWLMDFAASLGCSMEYLLVGTPAPGGRLDRMERRCSLFRDGTGWRPLDEFSTLGYRLEDFGSTPSTAWTGASPCTAPS